jgi:hypothetical protein
LSGRGHELRVTLNRHDAAILRGLEINRIYISGFGANYFYAKRLVDTAERMMEEIERRLGLKEKEPQDDQNSC